MQIRVHGIIYHERSTQPVTVLVGEVRVVPECSRLHRQRLRRHDIMEVCKETYLMLLNREVIKERVTWNNGLEKGNDVINIVCKTWQRTDALSYKRSPVVRIGFVLVDAMPMLKQWRFSSE